MAVRPAQSHSFFKFQHAGPELYECTAAAVEEGSAEMLAHHREEVELMWERNRQLEVIPMSSDAPGAARKLEMGDFVCPYKFDGALPPLPLVWSWSNWACSTRTSASAARARSFHISNALDEYLRCYSNVRAGDL